jgi:hypothetical protein
MSQLTARAYDSQMNEIIMPQKFQAIAGKYGRMNTSLITKWFPDMEISYVGLFKGEKQVFSVDLRKIVYTQYDKPIEDHQMVVWKKHYFAKCSRLDELDPGFTNRMIKEFAK